MTSGGCNTVYNSVSSEIKLCRQLQVLKSVCKKIILIKSVSDTLLSQLLDSALFQQLCLLIDEGPKLRMHTLIQVKLDPSS